MARVRKTYETVNQYRGQHDELEVEQIDPNDIRARRVRVLRPNRLRKYLGMKSITAQQCEAGELLALHWDGAGLVERVTGRYDGMRVTSVGSPSSSNSMDHRKAVRQALSGDRGPFADLLVSVCCYDHGVRDTRRLRRALTLLAVHFGIIRHPQQS